MNFSIPSNLNLISLLENTHTVKLSRRTTEDSKRVFKTVTIDSKLLIKHLPYCYFLIDQIVKQSYKIKDNRTGYVNLQSEILDKVIPQHTRIQIVSLLEYLQVIKVNHFYTISESSKGYRLTDTYALSEIVSINLTEIGQYIQTKNNEKGQSNDIINKVRDRAGNALSFLHRVKKIEVKIKRKRVNKTVDLLKYPEYGYQQNNIFNINLDYEPAVEWVNQNIGDIGKKNSAISSLNAIREGKASIDVNNSVNKVFSPITSLKKELRPFILDTDGRTLSIIDFSSSHLFHLIKLIQESTPSSALAAEMERLRTIAIGSGIYEHVQKQYYQENGEEITRDQAKGIFIPYFLYGKHKGSKKSIWVKRLFPEVSKFIGSWNRRALNIEIQKKESYLLNRLIFKRIAAEYPESMCYGMFDGVLVEDNYFDHVYTIIIEESIKYFGYKVPIGTAKIEQSKQSEREIISYTNTNAMVNQKQVQKTTQFNNEQFEKNWKVYAHKNRGLMKKIGRSENNYALPKRLSDYKNPEYDELVNFLLS